MKFRIVPSIALAAVAMATMVAAAEIKSGLQVGDAPGPFNVFDCTGPSTGKSLCYR